MSNPLERRPASVPTANDNETVAKIDAVNRTLEVRADSLAPGARVIQNGELVVIASNTRNSAGEHEIRFNDGTMVTLESSDALEVPLP